MEFFTISLKSTVKIADSTACRNYMNFSVKPRSCFIGFSEIQRIAL
jgi:hypothetical protein